MHAKTWILGGSQSVGNVLLTGSVNTTHGGLDLNKEHLIYIRDQDVIKKALRDCEETWEKATAVVEKDIETMMATAQAKQDKKMQGRSRSESVSRSPSVELDGVSSV